MVEHMVMLPDERYSMFGEINIIILEKWINKKSSQIDKQKGHKKINWFLFK